MKWFTAREYELKKGPLFGGLVIFPYQIAFGFSVGFWPCVGAPRLRLYLGPFKLWLSWIPSDR